MVRVFSNSEYIDIVLVYGEASEVLLGCCPNNSQ
jgi:hypothetical protein